MAGHMQINGAKSKLKVGIVMPHVGGGGLFQLSLGIADALLKYSRDYDYTLLYFDKETLQWLTSLTRHTPLVHIVPKSYLYRLNTLINLVLKLKILPMSSEKRASAIRNADLDLLIVPFYGLIGYTEDIPYIVTISSIMHTYYPDLTPFEDKLLAQVFAKNAARYSEISVVDSPQGTEDLHSIFHIPTGKIRIIPHSVSGYIYANDSMSIETAQHVLSKFRLPERYVFYPSDFEPLKNHKRLIQALSLIKAKYGIRVPLILAGRDGEKYRDELIGFVRQYQMADQVLFIGFMSDKEIVALYKLAVALVYTSLCGPTNLPPVEAMILGTPVLCSNIFSMPEQVGDAGLLFDPFSAEDMAEKIFMIWTDADLRRRLVENGLRKRKELTQEKYAMQWESVIGDAMQMIGKK